MTCVYRVLVVAACPFPYPRGTPIRILRTAEALAGRGHEVHVVTYHLGEAARTSGIVIHRIADVPTYRKYVPGPSWQKLAVVDVLLVRKLRAVLLDSSPEVIYAHHVEGLLLALAGRGCRRVPVVFDAHTMLESELPFYSLGLSRGMKRRIGRVLDTMLPRCATHVIAASDDIRRGFVARSPSLAGRISVIPSGVELERFTRSPAPAAARANTLIYTGNLAAYQGIDLMLRAFAELRGRRADVRLQIVSDGGFAAYEPLADRLGIRSSIDLLPASFADIPQQLASASIALNPRTDCAGVPQKLLNYMAAGMPIVSFAGSAKQLTHGELGWVVPNGDIPGFAAAIDRLLDDPALARSLGDNARAHVRAERSWARVAELVSEVFDRVAGARAAKRHAEAV